MEFISIFLNFLYVSEHVNATASCCCPLCCCPLACAFVLRVAWSPPHARWVIRFYQEGGKHNPVMVHLDLRWFHCTGYLAWARDHLFIGRADLLRDLVMLCHVFLTCVCVCHVVLKWLCHVGSCHVMPYFLTHAMIMLCHARFYEICVFMLMIYHAMLRMPCKIWCCFQA